MANDDLEFQDFVMIDDYVLDVTLSEDHEFESEITDYPVESGSNISDNIRPRPITVTMEGLVSKHPFDHIKLLRDVPESPHHPHDAYAVLLAIREDREPVTIRTSLDVFKDMALQSLSMPRDASTGDALRFTAKFQQIQTVENKRSKRTAIPAGKGKTNFGQLLAKIKSLAAIPVISVPVSQREITTKSYGKPILTTTEGPAKGPFANKPAAPGSVVDFAQKGGVSNLGIRKHDGRGRLDHYRIVGDTKLDGYVLQNIYYACASSGGSTTTLQTSIRGRPVEWDQGQNAWVTTDGKDKITQVVPKGQDRWKGVTTYNPKNGTGQTW